MTCNDCVHVEVCGTFSILSESFEIASPERIASDCEHFKDRSRFVELKSAEWIEDEDMYGDPIFRCSNCEARFVLEEGTPEDNDYCYCPTCGLRWTGRSKPEVDLYPAQMKLRFEKERET